MQAPHEAAKILQAHIQIVVRSFGGSYTCSQLMLGQHEARTVTIALPGGEIDLSLVLPPSYPWTPPTIMASVKKSGHLVQLPHFEWDLAVSQAGRLLSALKQLVYRDPSSSVHYMLGYGPSSKVVLTCDPNIAAQRGWKSYITTRNPEDTINEISSGLLKRTAGLIGRDIRSKTVLVIGCGSWKKSFSWAFGGWRRSTQNSAK